MHLTNLVITKRAWPTQWKESVILPTLKSNKPPGILSSYRPVVNLCSVSKIVERVLYDQMVQHLDDSGVIPHEQHGFRSGRSTDTALATLFSRIAQAQDQSLKIGLSAFDYSAAFDLVSWEVLESKLGWACCHAKSLLKSYMSNRMQKVQWNSSISKVLPNNFGVPQGSILAPLMFIILTGDLAGEVLIGTDSKTKSAVIQYADDTSGLCASKSWEVTQANLSTMGKSLESYSHKNQLHINMSKTQNLLLGHSTTQSSDSLNILGVTIDSKLNFIPHHEALLRDLRQRLGVIRRLKCQMSRGKLLNEVAQSLFVGRLQCNAWITRHARVNQEGEQPSSRDKAQILLNDLARTLLGIRRADHFRTEDLMDRAKLPTLNEIVVRQAALNAWKAVNGGTLAEFLQPYDSRTRGAENNLRRPVSWRCRATANMANCWNSYEPLRIAKTIGEARTAARKLANVVRHK